MELNHFSHDHPLILSEEEYCAFTDLDTCLCEICRTPLVGLCYCCHECTYALHKWCADLPLHMQNEFHPQHPLVLSREVPSDSVCDDCSKNIIGYAFCCNDCSFFLHVDCASLPQNLTVSLKKQKNPLKKLEVELERIEFNLNFRKKNKISKNYGNCFLCSYPVSGSMFSCPEFPDIFFHINCAMLPKSLKHARHVHFLDLAVNITDRNPQCEEFYCDNCEEERDVTRGAYYCEECLFVCHVSCAIVGLDRPIQRVLETNPIYVKARTWINPLSPSLWVPPKVDIDDEHKKEIRRDERRDEGEGTQFVHVSHEHPLFLRDEKLNTSYKCDACATSIFGKTYSCNECTYYLHKWCARFPQNIQHPLHYPHPLMLNLKHRFKCKYCNRTQDAFSYSCLGCNFEIDVQCASIKEYFRCEGHEHALKAILFVDSYGEDSMNENNIPVMYTLSIPCKACGYPCEGISLGCDNTQCLKYYIHVSCSLLPPSGKALTHRHNLSLCYSYKEDPRALEFFCDACEKERTPGVWVYVCPDEKCDIVSHIDCAVPEAVEHIFAVERHKELEAFEPPAKIIWGIKQEPSSSSSKP